jgi:hypothetical protein
VAAHDAGEGGDALTQRVDCPIVLGQLSLTARSLAFLGDPISAGTRISLGRIAWKIGLPTVGASR